MPLSDWAPAVAAVGARLRSRTTDTNGVEVGTFDTTTRPTGAQVLELITGNQSLIASEIGVTPPEASWPLAQDVTILGTIRDIELGFFPEQVASGRSPYEQVDKQYNEKLKRLIDYVSELAASSGEDSGAEGSGSPSYGFPEDQGGMVGWGSRW